MPETHGPSVCHPSRLSKALKYAITKHVGPNFAGCAPKIHLSESVLLMFSNMHTHLPCQIVRQLEPLGCQASIPGTCAHVSNMSCSYYMNSTHKAIKIYWFLTQVQARRYIRIKICCISSPVSYSFD